MFSHWTAALSIDILKSNMVSEREAVLDEHKQFCVHRRGRRRTEVDAVSLTPRRERPSKANLKCSLCR